MNTYYKILNEIAAAFDMDQWDEQVNTFTDVIETQLNYFVHNTENECIYILENSFSHNFPQFDFYKERCYVNGEKIKLDSWGASENKWRDQKTVKVIIKDLDKLGRSCKRMFYWCITLISVPQFDTSMVTNMRGMFYDCNSLVAVPLLNTTSVTDMDNMFSDCPSLSKETKQAWSSVYDFKAHMKK